MKQKSLYSQDLWDRFLKKTGNSKEDFELKKYPQFDPYFDFLNQSDKLKVLVEDPTLKSVSEHSFLPFIKILTKTPRYRCQDNISAYKLETKIRPISFASHFDTYLYAYYSFALTEKYQDYIKTKGFDEAVLAYRTDLNGKCNIQFAKEAFDEVKSLVNSKGKCAAIALDITGYFDNIDHSKLKEKWSKVIDENDLPIDQYKVFRSLTKYSYVRMHSILRHFDINLNKKRKLGERWNTLLDLIPDNIAGSRFIDKFNLLRKRNLLVTNRPKVLNNGSEESRGIPQGSSMSAVLSNIYLIDFDEWLYNLGKKEGFTYYRYCDDLLVICEIQEAKRLNELILDEIKKYKLKIQDRKTEHLIFQKNSKNVVRAFNQKKIIKENIKSLTPQNEQRFYKNLQYLGFEFNGQNIYIRPGSLSRYFRKMKGRIVKSIMMAYSNKGKSDKIFKKQIYERYSHIGKRNAAKKTYSNSKGQVFDGMDSLSIKRQLSAHFGIIEREIRKTSFQRFSQEDEKIKRRKQKKKSRKKRILKL